MQKFNYFKTIELKYKYQLSKKKPIVIRFDGRNITKSNTYDLSKKNAFTSALLSATKIIVDKFENCIAYVAIDEVNFIFSDPKEFFDMYTDNSDSLQYCLSIFQQHFLNIFWKEVPDVFFGVSIFNIPNDKIDSYLSYRKSSAYNVAVTYFAKRNIPKERYKNKKQSDILDCIKELGKYNQFVAYTHFSQGTIFTKESIEQSDENDEFVIIDF